MIGYDDFILADDNESFDEQFFIKGFTNGGLQNSIPELYSYLRFWQYLDAENIQNLSVREQIKFLLEDPKYSLSFSDISPCIKLFQERK